MKWLRPAAVRSSQKIAAAFFDEVVGFLIDTNNEWILHRVLTNEIHEFFDCLRHLHSLCAGLDAQTFDNNLLLGHRV